jgi:hypothetical protein
MTGQKIRIPVHPRKEGNSVKQFGVFVVTVVFLTVCAFKFAAVVKAQPGIELSGYELLLGSSCVIDGQAGKCGVEFVGWTGGGGATENGWKPFPGDRRGLWDAEIDYIGSPNFASAVTLAGGSFDLLLKNGQKVSGAITGGSVTWPREGFDDEGCGTNVARVTVYQNANLLFSGCLHDLPAGAVIPPTIWGTLY